MTCSHNVLNDLLETILYSFEITSHQLVKNVGVTIILNSLSVSEDKNIISQISRVGNVNLLSKSRVILSLVTLKRETVDCRQYSSFIHCIFANVERLE